MMSGTPGMRLLFAILSPVFLLLCVVAIRGEEKQEWGQYQTEFAQLFADRARAKLQEVTAEGDARQVARWQRIVSEVSNWQPEVKQVYIEDMKVADRCTTCHLGVDNPLFEDAPEPFRTHPGALLETHEVTRFGCTVCHEGQGLATTADAAHGHEANWSRAMLPTTLLQSTCVRCHAVTHGLAGAEFVTQGADLFMAKGCYGCHDIPGISYLPKFAPPLANLKSKLTDPEAWVQAWIKDPPSFAADTLMPNFLLKEKEEEVGHITAFVLTLGEPTREAPVVVDPASAEEGKKLFTERGCRGCHGVETDEKSASPRVPHLGTVGSKITAEWLDRYIGDPKEVNADTAMPKVELEDDERRAIVAYLLTLKRTEPLPAGPDVSQFDPAKGKELAKEYECFGCHTIEGFEETRPSVPDLAEFARRPVDELDFGSVPVKDLPRTKWDWLRHKFREPRAYESEKIKLKMPTSPLTDDEAEALIAFCLALDAPSLPARYVVSASPADQARRDVRWMITRLNCKGCHPLDGDEAHLAQFFERKSRVPPMLDDVGARLQGQYMYDFLLEPESVRPWLAMRMPIFGFTEPQARTLVEGFAALVQVSNPYTYVAKVNIPQENFDRGFRRFRHHKCIQCHPSSIEGGLPEDLDPDDLSINLMLSKERLRPEWFADFMARPKQIAGTHTRMPTVFYTVDGVPKVERPKEDINDIVTYVMGMKEDAEITLKAYDEMIKAEEEKEQIDWTNIEY
jgi:mono/diheme cytochrome c family protein